MNFTRRQFVRGGVAAFTWGFAAPAILSRHRAGAGREHRNLVVLYLGGGNDSLNTVIPYTDAFYYSRRPTIAVQPGDVLQIGTDVGQAGRPAPADGRASSRSSIRAALAIFNRTGYPNLSRSHFSGLDVWSSANPTRRRATGWLGRYLDTLPSTRRSAGRLVSHARNAAHDARAQRRRARDSEPAAVRVPQPELGRRSGRRAQHRGAHLVARAGRSSASRVRQRHVQRALATLDRVATVATYQPTVTYPNTGLGQALRAVAGAMVRGIGTKVFWVQTGGFDTHASQGTAMPAPTPT